MIKIGPLVATEYAQACALIKLQEDIAAAGSAPSDVSLAMRSLSFWQHWLPFQFHMMPSAYVAREDGVVLGIVSVRPTGKSRLCWRIESLVVHPDHRGRGIGAELLKYTFAQFGSQGVSHFIAEVPASSDAALALFASCGFCRSARVTYLELSESGRHAVAAEVREPFRLAVPSDRYLLYQLHQEALPPDLRMILAQSVDDYVAFEPLPYTPTERTRQRLMRKRLWYWVSGNDTRRVLTSSVRVKATPDSGYRLDFAVHPGWKDLSLDVVNFATNALAKDAPQARVWSRVLDFQTEVAEALRGCGFERSGEYFLLSREHWVRSRKKEKRKGDATVALPSITNPAINFPLATERRLRRQPDQP